MTLNPNKRSVDFFKASARQNGVSYQSMTRRVLDINAERYQHEPS